MSVSTAAPLDDVSTGPDPRTLGYYDSQAAAYAAHAAREARRPWLERFMEQLPPAAEVIDLGCGSGWAAARMLKGGHQVLAIDASAGLAAEARRLYGVDVVVGRFDVLEACEAFDGIWASFSLLHDPRAAMPLHLARIARALRPGGVFYLGLKEGRGVHRDRHGRLCTYFTEAELRPLLAEAGFCQMESELEQGLSYSGCEDGFLHILMLRTETA